MVHDKSHNEKQHAAGPKWKGYSLEQLENRRLINRVKCDLIKEQLAIVGRSATSRFSDGGGASALGSSINQYMTYASYGVTFFKYARRLYSIYRTIRQSLGSGSKAESLSHSNSQR